MEFDFFYLLIFSLIQGQWETLSKAQKKKIRSHYKDEKRKVI
jgi:hypothetical protein